VAISSHILVRPLCRRSRAEHAAAYNGLRSDVTAAGLLTCSLSFYLPLIVATFGCYALPDSEGCA
jgi:hypothetical protein